MDISEVAKHNRRDDCWVVINGTVYDVTKWLNDHPGGIEVVMELAGQDATFAYNEVGHSNIATQEAVRFKVGTLSSCLQTADIPTHGVSKPVYRGRKPEDAGAYLFGVTMFSAAVAYGAHLIRS